MVNLLSYRNSAAGTRRAECHFRHAAYQQQRRLARRNRKLARFPAAVHRARAEGLVEPCIVARRRNNHDSPHAWIGVLMPHRLHRQIEFLSQFPELEATKVDVSEKVVDPESNLKPDVIRKNLFRLGFQQDMFQPHESTVHHLLNKRNAVAHGSTRLGVEEDEYNELEAAVLDIMDDVVRLLFEALRHKAYLRQREPDYAI
jgi:hypothetical protein